MAYNPDSRCYQVCKLSDGTIWTGGCKILQKNVQCNTSAGFCNWTGLLTNCYYSGSTACTEGSQTTTKSCCGCPNPPCDNSGGSGSPTPTPSPTPPPACTATYPDGATPVSPANNSTVSGDSVVLDWDAPSDWGTGCPSNNNRYLLNVWDDTAGQWVKDSQGNDYNHKIIMPPVSSETVPLSGLAGHQIGWRVITDNGTYQNDGTHWNFNVASLVRGTVQIKRAHAVCPHR